MILLHNTGILTMFHYKYPSNPPPPRNCVIKIENLVTETQNKLFIFPYFREEGGGQKGYQNVHIFMSLLGGGGRGSK